jgi:hypothetical protein
VYCEPPRSSTIASWWAKGAARNFATCLSQAWERIVKTGHENESKKEEYDQLCPDGLFDVVLVQVVETGRVGLACEDVGVPFQLENVMK